MIDVNVELCVILASSKDCGRISGWVLIFDHFWEFRLNRESMGAKCIKILRVLAPIFVAIEFSLLIFCSKLRDRSGRPFLR